MNNSIKKIKMRKLITSIVLLCILSITAVLCSKINIKTITAADKIGVGVLNGPESILFDKSEPDIVYTGISDGSIRKVNLATGEITLYAYTVPTLDATVRATCGQSILNEKTCGRPLGLTFDANGDMLVADAYFGVLKISKSDPSNVETIVNSYQGVPFTFTNSIVVLKDGRTAYFTVSSTTYFRNQFVAALVSNKPDGRLFKLDLVTKQITLILDDIPFANGIALSKDERFLVINECGIGKIRRYWLKGPKAGMDDQFVDNIGGYNDNIMADGKGNFLVALYSLRSDSLTAVQEHEDLGVLVNKYIPPAETIGMVKRMGVVKRVDEKGRIIEVIEDLSGLNAAYISEAHEHNGFLYFGSVIFNFITRVNKSTQLV